VADDFGTAIYTNCAPGQGLGGVGGMQFQSCSAGVDPKALALIRRHLIYEPPERFILERQSIETFPPSFAHVHDGLFATAAGVYIGREADGPRQGNHLTHAIFSSDAGSYHSIRPAQMFRAPFWRNQPEPTTHSERLTVPLQPRPFDAADACRFVNSQPSGDALLTALLAALLALGKGGGSPHSRRVLFISEAVDPVLYWLTAATLLIPHHDAVRIGFKVFTTDPARSALPVLAVHPDWARSSATVEDDRGYAVFDLVQHRWSQMPENTDAQHWANLFCTADPYEVSDAVELAAASGLSADSARDLATAVLWGHIPEHADADALVTWLRTGPPVAREAYGGKLFDALLQLQDPNLLLSLDLIATTQFPGRSDNIRLSLLRRQLDDALAHQSLPRQVQSSRSSVFASDRARRRMSTQVEPEATQLVTEYLRQAEGAAFDRVMRVGAKFGVSVPLEHVLQATVAFVAWLADNPAAAYDPSRWPPEPPVHRMLIGELSKRITSRPASATSTADQWWNRLGNWTPDRADITSPLDRALVSASMANSGEQDRLRIVRATLGRRGSFGIEAYYSELATVLWDRVTATTQEICVLRDAVPAGTKLDPGIFSGVLARVTGDPTGLPELELCADLSAKRLLVLDTQAVELIESHRWLEQCEYRLSAGAPPADLIGVMQLVPPPLVTAHAWKLARSLLAIEDPVLAMSLAPRLPTSVALAYLRALGGNAAHSGTPASIAVAFTISRLPDMWWAQLDARGDLRKALIAEMEKRREEMSGKESKEVARRLAPLGDEMLKAWKGGSGWWRRYLWVARFNSTQQTRAHR